MYKSINVHDFYNLNNVNIIDIREAQKYNNSHINSSINIPFNKLLINFKNLLDKNKIYYIYCDKGIESTKMCQILSNNGYNVININGGYEALKLKK